MGLTSQPHSSPPQRVKRPRSSMSPSRSSSQASSFSPPTSDWSFPPLPSSSGSNVSPVFGASSSSSWPRFLILSSTQSGTGLNSISPFLLTKSVYALAGTPLQIKRLRSGDFLIECRDQRQSNSLLSTKSLGSTGITVDVQPHRSLNSSKGVIRCPELDHTPLDEISSELKSQGVSGVVRHSIKRDGAIVPTHTYFITFDSPIPPHSLLVGYLKVSVSPYFPNPLRCYNCQRYGHGSKHCRSAARCSNWWRPCL